MYFYLSPGYRDDIIEDLPLFEICVDAHELNVLGTFFKAAAVLDDFLEANSGPSSCTYGSFSPL